MNWIDSKTPPNDDTVLLLTSGEGVRIGMYTQSGYYSYGSRFYPKYYCIIPEIPNV